MIRTRFALCIALSATTAAATDGLDPTFGGDGFVALGFQAVAGLDEDRAVLGCAGPQDTFVVTGFASGGQRVVTAWLREDGTLARGFGNEGKASYTLPAGVLSTQRGLCRPNGTLLLAFERLDAASGEGDLHLLQLRSDTGLPDATFGGGHVVVDLDLLAPGLGALEVPLALMEGQNGDALVGGEYDDDTGRLRGFALRIAAGGQVAGSQFSQHDISIARYTAIGNADDGTVWALAEHDVAGPREASVSRLHADTLAPLGAVAERIGGALSHTVGRMVSGHAMGVAGRVAGSSEAVLALVSAAGVTLHTLPRSEANEIIRPVDVVPAPHGRVYVGGDGFRPPPHVVRPLFFARFRPTARGLVLDRSFGEAGVQRVSLPQDPCVTGSGHRRLTLWKQRPVSVGHVTTQCAGAAGQIDYQALRLLQPTIGDGFE